MALLGKRVVPGLGREFWLDALAGPVFLGGYVGEHVVPVSIKYFWVAALAVPDLLDIHVGKHVVLVLGKDFWLAALAGSALLVEHVGKHVIPGLGKDFWVAALAGPALLGERVVLGLGKDCQAESRSQLLTFLVVSLCPFIRLHRTYLFHCKGYTRVDFVGDFLP